MAYSFSTSGAVPTNTTIPYHASVDTASTPAAKALAGMVAPASAISTLPNSFNMQTTTPAVAKPVDFSQVATTSGLIPKSQTITNPDGSSHTTTYQPPVNNAPLGTAANPQKQGSNPTPYDPITAIPASSQQQASTGNSGASTGILAPQANGTPTTFPGILGALTDTSLNPNPEIQQTIDQAAAYKEQVARALGTIGSTPGPLGNQLGLESNINSAASLQEQANAEKLAALQGLQATKQTGLTSAAGLAQPSTAAYGQTTYSPTTNSFGNGSSNLDPQTQATSLAKQVMSGQLTYDQALSSLGYAGSAGTNFLNNAITSAGGNPLSLQSQGAGQQGVLQSIPGLQAANTAAQGIANQITTFLQQNPQINQSSAALANAAQQWISGKQLTDPAYQTFFNDLNEYTNTLAPILGVGGDPTNLKTQIAQGFINAHASGQSIAQVLKSIGDLATTKVQNLQSGATGGSVVNPATQNGTSSLFSW